MSDEKILSKAERLLKSHEEFYHPADHAQFLVEVLDPLTALAECDEELSLKEIAPILRLVNLELARACVLLQGGK